MVLFLRRLFRDGAPAYHVDKETGERRLTGADPAPAAYVAAAARYLREARADLKRAEGDDGRHDLTRGATVADADAAPHVDALEPATEDAAASLLARLVRRGDPLDSAQLGLSAGDPETEGEEREDDGAPC